ncbi:unnamed protein product [Acanthosepion pharaonis]|uniref:Uncharacterized protein n=1 Tax=Acanthosepion pharaonis TaxID=158019 RepID=A0A812C230_ACAPH|nr:unnamed protein product [Sepia pharaonis]
MSPGFPPHLATHRLSTQTDTNKMDTNLFCSTLQTEEWRFEMEFNSPRRKRRRQDWFFLSTQTQLAKKGNSGSACLRRKWFVSVMAASARTHPFSLSRSLPPPLSLSTPLSLALSPSPFLSLSLSLPLSLFYSLSLSISLFHVLSRSLSIALSRSLCRSRSLSLPFYLSPFLSLSLARSLSLIFSLVLSHFRSPLSISLSPSFHFSLSRSFPLSPLFLSPPFSLSLSFLFSLVLSHIRSLSLSFALSLSISLSLSLPLSLPFSLSPFLSSALLLPLRGSSLSLSLFLCSYFSPQFVSLCLYRLFSLSSCFIYVRFDLSIERSITGLFKPILVFSLSLSLSLSLSHTHTHTHIFLFILFPHFLFFQ